MRYLPILLFTCLLSIGACKSKKTAEQSEQLPKDIAEMPERDYSEGLAQERERDQKALGIAREEIEALISSTSCSDAAGWRTAALGSKPCGGPATFIAYPISLEEELLEKITRYNKQSSEFNLKYGLISDCAVVAPPAGVRCENGKPVLFYQSEI